MHWGALRWSQRAPRGPPGVVPITVRPCRVLRRFVARDLAAVDRSVTPWVVVGLHRMMVAPATWRSK